MNYKFSTLLVALFLISCSQSTDCSSFEDRISIKQVELQQLKDDENELQKLDNSADSVFRLLDSEFDRTMRRCRGEKPQTCASFFSEEFASRVPEPLSSSIYSISREKPDPSSAKASAVSLTEDFVKPIREKYAAAKDVRISAAQDLNDLIAEARAVCE